MTSHVILKRILSMSVEREARGLFICTAVKRRSIREGDCLWGEGLGSAVPGTILCDKQAYFLVHYMERFLLHHSFARRLFFKIERAS